MHLEMNLTRFMPRLEVGGSSALFDGARNAVVKVVCGVKNIICDYVLGCITGSLQERDVKVANPLPYQSLSVSPEMGIDALKEPTIKPFEDRPPAYDFVDNDVVDNDVVDNDVVDNDVVEGNKSLPVDFYEPENDVLDGSDPTQAIRPLSPGILKAQKNFRFEPENFEPDEKPSGIPQVTITNESSDSVKTGSEQSGTDHSVPVYSLSAHQTSLVLSLSLLGAMSQRFNLPAPEGLSILDGKTDEVSLRLKSISEQSLASLGKNVNKGMQDLYKDLFQFGLHISTEDMKTPRAAFTTKAGAQLDETTDRLPEVRRAWENLQQAALAVLEAADGATNNPVAHCKLKRRSGVLEKKQDRFVDCVQRLRRLGDHKALRPVLRQTYGRYTVHQRDDKDKYNREKVAPLVDELDANVKEWLDNSPEWQWFLGAYRGFEAVMQEKVPDFAISDGCCCFPDAGLGAWTFDGAGAR